MKKQDLIRAIKKGWPDSNKMVNELFRAINKALVDCESVTINNFGRFYVTKPKKRNVYDINKGRNIIHPGSYKIKFKPSAKIQKILNQKNISIG